VGDRSRVTVAGQRDDFAGFWVARRLVVGEEAGLMVEAVPVAIGANCYDMK
jgi:hypothetical protein